LNCSNADRKLEHIEISLKEDVEGPLTTWLECVHLIHNAVPELNISEVDTSVTFLGKKLSAPLIISGMTGGAPSTEKINAELAKVVEALGLGLGVGSQRSAIECEHLKHTFNVVRSYAPKSLVIANIGIYEFIKYDLGMIEKVVNMVEADALAVHLNVVQELTQPEGSHDFRGFLNKLKEVSRVLPVPIIIKEVGFGLSKDVASVIGGAGVNYFDVAGAGGTNWAKIELLRARRKGDRIKEYMALELLRWGIPTAASIVEVRTALPSAGIIASGGIRGALDVVKSIRLGADVAGMALPILKAYYRGELMEYLRGLINSIKAILLLTGSRNVNELKTKPVVIYDPLRTWIIQRNLKVIM